jgi:hypothetical protein
MVSIHEPILKKSRMNAKRCALCKKHGGAHATHNTSDCCKYNKDGKLKKSFRKSQRGSTASDKKPARVFTQLLAKIAKLEKVNEKLKTCLQKRKHNYSSDSDDSDSS